MLEPAAFRGFPRRLDWRVPEESLRRKQRAPRTGLAEGEPTPQRHSALSRCGSSGRSFGHLLRVRWCASGGGGGPAWPSAMVPLRGERCSCGSRLLLGSSSDWGLLSEGLHFLTGAGVCRRKQTNLGMQPPYLVRQLSEG